MKQVRVLVVDDSALMRKLIPQMLAVDESIDVVGTAMDGSFCLKKIEELKPNVVTLDLEMPGMNGIDTLKEIMRHKPVPVIVFSSHSTEGATVTMKALGLGAFDFVTKPKDASAHMAETARELIAKVKAAADCKLKPRVLPGAQPKPEKAPAPTGAARSAPRCRPCRRAPRPTHCRRRAGSPPCRRPPWRPPGAPPRSPPARRAAALPRATSAPRCRGPPSPRGCHGASPADAAALPDRRRGYAPPPPANHGATSLATAAIARCTIGSFPTPCSMYTPTI